MIYSRHCFLFPFVWTNGYDAKQFFDLFQTDSDNNIWVCLDGKREKNSLRSVTAAEMKRNPIEFDKYQYFNNLGRNLLYSDSETPLVYSFGLMPDYYKNLHYIITTRETSYKLEIREIILKIYSTGIAVFTINCQNTSYEDIQAVKNINEYGRRLAMPYWKTASGDNCKCADKLEIVGEKISVSDDFSSFHDGQVSLSYISKIVRNLLNRNGKNIVFRAKMTSRKNEIEIKPVWDGKMFVACLITDREAVRELYNDYYSSGGSFSSSKECDLVELVNVDIGGGCSLLCEKDRKEFLENSLYTALFGGDMPKLSAVTANAYIKLVAEDDYDSRYFSEIYCQIIMIALVQRMSIAVFGEEIQGIYQAVMKKGRITNKEISQVMNLQRRYVAFCNSYLLNEITPKREGQFLYQRIRSALEIVTENEMIESQFNRIYELVNTSQGYSFNKWGLIISLIALEFNTIGFIQTGKTLSDTSVDIQNGLWVIALFVAVAVVIVFVIQLLFRHKK